MKKTLVIHPHDESTHFLKPIYEDIPNKTIITGGLWQNVVIDLIEIHDRIIMLGHGSPKGLFGIGFGSNYVIGKNEAELLKDKECIFIWCHADQFVKEHNLKGFYSGMFVSEVGEALFFNLNSNKQLINESNDVFAHMLGSVIDTPLNDAFGYIKNSYGKLAETNEIAKYNNERLGLAE
jgi:hypothetical protein